ncbi:Hypothetical protein POVN_LOCUS469 [uncultured virus]|nr:Hypothetical protein POVN_LOCUS469 [uncultured virus]
MLLDTRHLVYFWVVTGITLTIMGLQVKYQLIPQLNSDSIMATKAKLSNVTEFGPTTTSLDCRDPREKDECQLVTVKPLSYNMTWLYTVAAGKDMGGRNVTIPKVPYNLTNQQITRRMGVLNEVGKVVDAYYDPNAPGTLYFTPPIPLTAFAFWMTILTAYVALNFVVFAIKFTYEWHVVQPKGWWRRSPQPPPPPDFDGYVPLHGMN